ncbi:TPA: hypothetical protein HA278_00255 [Candidatus Woesearchaeota archaeon]|nr:hypothetical protein [archaeon]HIJ10460.1 hypothetical protein [Candidatus Woesearchaeota archaeon]
MTVFTNVNKNDLDTLRELGFHDEDPKTIYEVARLRKNNISVVYYESRKLLIQGKEDAIKKFSTKLRSLGIGKEMKKEVFRKEEGWVIGSDETLKGDTFGGLVVASVKADGKLRIELMALGVADSKRLKDEEIMEMAYKIKRLVPCEIRSVLPEEYNKYDGVTPLLNRLHKECGDYLKPGTHVVDKYPGCKVGDVQETKAESKYLEVAAASVLARAAGLAQMRFLSKEAGFDLPLGSTHVSDALERLKESGKDFRKFTKMHFRNVRAFLER